jgi:hypothetical protein
LPISITDLFDFKGNRIPVFEVLIYGKQASFMRFITKESYIFAKKAPEALVPVKPSSSVK